MVFKLVPNVHVQLYMYSVHETGLVETISTTYTVHACMYICMQFVVYMYTMYMYISIHCTLVCQCHATLCNPFLYYMYMYMYMHVYMYAHITTACFLHVP